MALRVSQVEPQLQVCSARRPLRERAKRGLEPGFLEHVRVEVEYGIAQLPDRLHERLVGASESGMGDRFADFLEYVTHGEEVLESMIVERVRERLAFTLLRFERVAEQVRPRLGQLLDPVPSSWRAASKGGRRRRRPRRGNPPG